jgi:hypothetical protein
MCGSWSCGLGLSHVFRPHVNLVATLIVAIVKLLQHHTYKSACYGPFKQLGFEEPHLLSVI